MTLTSEPGTGTGTTKITVKESKFDEDDAYKYLVGTDPTVPDPGDTISDGWTNWDGDDDIAAETGKTIVVAEVDEDGVVIAVGTAEVAANNTLTVTSVAGTETGKTAITVAETKETGNAYKYKVGTDPTVPEPGDTISGGWTNWDGTAEITAETGKTIVVAEVDGSSKVVAVGTAEVVSKEAEE